MKMILPKRGMEARMESEMKLYLLVLGATIKLEDVKQYVDKQNDIKDWFYSMPNSMFLVSELSASDLYQRLRLVFKDGRLFITEVSGQNRQGWLPRDHWEKMKRYQSLT